MKRLIIPENFVRALCKIDRRIYGYGRCSDAVEAAIGYVSGKYQFQKESAKAHGVSRYKAHAASHVIYKSWQENRELVIGEAINNKECGATAFVSKELAAIAAGIDTSNGLFDPTGCDDSAFKLSVAIKPDILDVDQAGCFAMCEKEFGDAIFKSKILINAYRPEHVALREALHGVACQIGLYKSCEKRGEKHASNN